MLCRAGNGAATPPRSCGASQHDAESGLGQAAQSCCERRLAEARRFYGAVNFRHRREYVSSRFYSAFAKPRHAWQYSTSTAGHAGYHAALCRRYEQTICSRADRRAKVTDDNQYVDYEFLKRLRPPPYGTIVGELVLLPAAAFTSLSAKS